MDIFWWLPPRDFEKLDSALAKIKYLVAIELRTMLFNILVACRFQFPIDTWSFSCYRRLQIVRAQFSPCAFVNLVFRYFVFVPASWRTCSIITSNRSDTQRFDVCKMFLRIKCLSWWIRVICSAKSRWPLHRLYWKLSDLFGHPAKFKVSNSEKFIYLSSRYHHKLRLHRLEGMVWKQEPQATRVANFPSLNLFPFRFYFHFETIAMTSILLVL